MPVTISELPSASAVTSDDLVLIVNEPSGSSKQTQVATFQQVLEFITGSNFNILEVTSLTASNLQTNTISASTYIGLPALSSFELTKLNVNSSVSLLTTQRAVFATNSISSSITITMPDIASADSREYYVIKADSLSGSVIVSGSGSNLINGQGTFQLNGPYQSITLITDGSSWFIF